jgi:hypothetical protein
MPTLEHNHLVFRFPQIEKEARFSIDFQRTLRIPDTDKTYPLPPGLGSFPLRHWNDTEVVTMMMESDPSPSASLKPMRPMSTVTFSCEFQPVAHHTCAPAGSSDHRGRPSVSAATSAVSVRRIERAWSPAQHRV